MAFDKAKFLSPVAETETVTVPGFGPVTVRPLTGAEYDRYEVACTGKGEDGKSAYRTDRPLLVRLAAVDPDTGEAAFADADLPALRRLPAAVLIPVARAVVRMCGLGEDAGGN